MGRAPIRHPPGSTVSARPIRASSGAQNRMDARIFAAGPLGNAQRHGPPRITRSSPCQAAAQPTPCKRARQASTSDRRGTPRRQTGPSHSSAAASRGSTLFLAAGTLALPHKGRPPVTIKLPPIEKPPFLQQPLRPGDDALPPGDAKRLHHLQNIPHGMQNRG